MSDKWSGAKATHYTVIAMICLVVGVGIVVLEAVKYPEKEDILFPIFLVLFLLLFVTTGVGNASTYRMVTIIFPKHEAGPVLGWCSAIAAYGA
ncbi:MAG: antiporter, partial [bacterium]|nr:antiporter [bacterium]